jgi:PRC-barrel domain
MAMQQSSENFAARETTSLIASDKVEGTAVYRSNGDKVGTVQRMMIHKLNGNVAYVVLSFGGFLGIGDDYHPLPWSMLKYSERLGGYQVDITDQQLKSAPKFRPDETWDWSSRTRQVSDYYHTPYV